MKKEKGFTLVELLAVIVILAIIMIIAIPSVLNTMRSAKRKTFEEMAKKVFIAAQQKYILREQFGELKKPGGYDEIIYLFDIKNDLDIPSTGNVDGIVLVLYVTNNYGLRDRNTNKMTEYRMGDIFFSVLLDDDNYSGVYIYSNDGEQYNINETQLPFSNILKQTNSNYKDFYKSAIVNEITNYNAEGEPCYVNTVYLDGADNSFIIDCYPSINYKWDID